MKKTPLFLFFLFGFLSPLFLQATTWHVATTGNNSNTGTTSTNPFLTIQHGIDVSSDGDIILVEPGTYTENIDFDGKNITVESTTGAANTIIDANQNGSGVHIGSGELTSILDGFTIQNGTGTPSNVSYSSALVRTGGGIIVHLSSSATLRNLIVINNEAANGGGIAVHWSSPNTPNVHIENCIIKNNNAGKGGGIIVSNGAEATIVNCLVANNSTYSNNIGGGGIIIDYSSRAIISNTTIANNTAAAANQGGGITIANNGSNLTATDCIIWGNTPTNIRFVGPPPSQNSISFSSIEGGQAGASGTGNINSDPLFSDPLNYDYSLQTNSPCIDAGSNNGALTDISGNTRPNGNGFDMGAYEFYATAPCPSTLHLTGQIAHGTYQTSNSITSNGIIAPGASTNLLSSSILMEDNFEVSQGADFLAAIQPCGNVVLCSKNASVNNIKLTTSIIQLGVVVKKKSNIVLEISDKDGNVVYENSSIFKVGEYTNTLPIATIPEGVYLLKISINNNSATKRIAVNKTATK